MQHITFGAALERLKDGAKVARAGWNGKGMWLTLIHPGNAMYTKGGGAYPMQPCIGMKTATGDMQPGWLASQADMLAADWIDLSPIPEGLAAYKCHKVVLAGRIHEIEQDGFPGGFCRLVFTPRDQLAEEVGICERLSIVVPEAYVQKHKPTVGGYYVLYTGGYESFSPADSFIEGYSKLAQATA